MINIQLGGRGGNIRMSVTARAIARKILGPRYTNFVRRLFRRRPPGLEWYLSVFDQKSGLEGGGPSQIFSECGAIPVYNVLKTLDNCLFSNRTIWEGEVQEGLKFKYHALRPPGYQFVLEGARLLTIGDHSYDCVLSSHTLEHFANPLQALKEWKRVSRKDGLLLLLLPHKDGTFDWRRTPTSVAHMIEDYSQNIGEDDLTHLSEVLELHDLRKDPPAGSFENFRSRCLQNHTYRAMHHHVFDTATAVAMLDYAGFQLLRVDHLKPFHIILVARCCDQAPDNGAFLAPDAEYLRRSPFRSDHLGDRR
jgi:SAM-dependent methyltransferase